MLRQSKFKSLWFCGLLSVSILVCVGITYADTDDFDSPTLGENWTWDDPDGDDTYGCLVIWQDGNNWLHLELIRNDGDGRDGVHAEHWPGGVRHAIVNIEPDEVYLRIERKGDDWHLFYKLKEEDDWEALDVVTLKIQDPHQVGIGAKTWGGPDGPLVADFDYFRCPELGEVKAVEPDYSLSVTWAKIKVTY